MQTRETERSLAMANLPAQMLPSVSEVDAIKQQLKLLGHSLPTEVIVKFLQDNSELLTACQNPSYGSSSSRPVNASLQHASMRAPTQPNVTVATQGAQDPPSIQFSPEPAHHIGPITPQLDVTWASEKPGDILPNRPSQVKSSACGKPATADVLGFNCPAWQLFTTAQTHVHHRDNQNASPQKELRVSLALATQHRQQRCARMQATSCDAQGMTCE